MRDLIEFFGMICLANLAIILSVCSIVMLLILFDKNKSKAD